MLSFSEWCQKQFVTEIPEWQKEFLDGWYKMFEEHRRNKKPLYVYAPRQNAKSSIDFELIGHLLEYLNYLEEENGK